MDQWQVIEKPTTFNTGVTEWSVWTGSWKSKYLPTVGGNIETVLIDNPTDINKFYEANAFVSSTGFVKQDPESVTICIQIQDHQHLSIYANHEGYEVTATGIVKNNLLKGKYYCRSTGDRGSFQLTLST